MIDIKRKSRHAKKSTFALKLTPLIDMMTILLVFLLKSYSAEGQIVTVTQDLRLPESTADTRPRVTSVVAVTSEWILLDGRPISRVRRVLDSDRLLIPELGQELTRLRAISQGIGDMSNQMAGFQGNIAIQGDREITFDLLKRIMLTCGRIGYNNMLLTVLQRN